MKIKVSKYVKENIGRNADDFIVQTFRAGGPGGQHQNKTESAVRIIDKKTGISAECREERSQVQNKKKAFLKLVDLLILHYQKQEKESSQDFRSNEIVRTYDFHNNIVVNKDGTKHNLKKVMKGEIPISYE